MIWLRVSSGGGFVRLRELRQEARRLEQRHGQAAEHLPGPTTSHEWVMIRREGPGAYMEDACDARLRKKEGSRGATVEV